MKIGVDIFGLEEKVLSYLYGRSQDVEGFIDLITKNKNDINFGAIGIVYKQLTPEEFGSVRGYSVELEPRYGYCTVIFPLDCDVRYRSKIQRFVDMRDPLGR
ncbi:MAG: hypothetical protein HY051_01190 [Candidatus Aenigmarchaeota archaeon]|nr:hypothetical protein [Candidatus Aenigmarchaeota archaeon]